MAFNFDMEGLFQTIAVHKTCQCGFALRGGIGPPTRSLNRCNWPTHLFLSTAGIALEGKIGVR